MLMGARLDGHIVQGHVDQTATCQSVKEKDGSWFFTFSYDASLNNVTIEHTRFNTYTKGTLVNLEFDVIGKYVAKLMSIS